MPNPLFNQLNPNVASNNIISQIMNFRKTFTGDPKQMVQQMLNSGKVSQAQINQYVEQANRIYEQMNGSTRFLKS